MTDLQTIYVIVGPTASGKTAHALSLAASVPKPLIINADSMQIYDGLSTLTAQPTAQEQAAFPHALYGTLHPNESASAGNWREWVLPLIDKTLTAGGTPLIVGGSGLYINALLYGLSPVPDIPDNVRRGASAKQKELGNPAFHTALADRDPIMAARLDPYNTARLVRAWEVLDATGQSLSVWQDKPKEAPPPHWQFNVTLVMPERETLYDRCNQRLHQMLENGALEEIKDFRTRIAKKEVRNDVLLTHALGYEPLSAYLDDNQDKETAVSLAQGETRRYAKRQVTWFKHQIKENKNVASIKIIG